MSICVFKFRRYNIHSVNVQTHQNRYSESALFNDATYTDKAALEATTAVCVIVCCRDMNTGGFLSNLTLDGSICHKVNFQRSKMPFTCTIGQKHVDRTWTSPNNMLACGMLGSQFW